LSPLSKITFDEWQDEQRQDAKFVAAARELEPGYQIARLRIQHGLTQAQLAELVGTRQPSIARLESGERKPSLSFLQRVAEVLSARIEVRLVPLDTPDVLK